MIIWEQNDRQNFGNVENTNKGKKINVQLN